MSFRKNREQLENNFAILNQQASMTNEAWKDSVQERFYNQFINTLPKEFNIYINELMKLDKSFEKAEQTINHLQK